jgi:hypothetical protein
MMEKSFRKIGRDRHGKEWSVRSLFTWGKRRVGKGIG